MQSLPSARVPTKPNAPVNPIRRPVPPAPEPPRPAARCALRIPDRHGNRWAYEVTRLDPDRRTGVLAAYRLHKACTDTTYTIALTQAQGPSCECGDWIFRRDGKDRDGCKHVRTLRAFGMLPELPPAAAHVAHRPGYFGDDRDGDPLRPAVTESVTCPVCLGACIDPADENASARCGGCGGMGEVPAPEPVEAPSADGPEAPLYTPEDMRQLTQLAQLLHITDDNEPPF